MSSILDKELPSQPPRARRRWLIIFIPLAIILLLLLLFTDLSSDIAFVRQQQIRVCLMM